MTGAARGKASRSTRTALLAFCIATSHRPEGLLGQDASARLSDSRSPGPYVVRARPELDELLPPVASIERVADGFL